MKARKKINQDKNKVVKYPITECELIMNPPQDDGADTKYKVIRRKRRKKNKIIEYSLALLISFSLLLSSGCQFNNASSDSKKSDFQNKHLTYGIPSTNGKILYRTGYVLLHDNKKKEPIWVSYHLTADELNLPQLKRSNKFAPDPDLLAGERAELSDYKNSGYDRGHMCPNADQSWSAITMKECFYLSNMCPQIHSLNAGEWSKLETKVRSFTKKKGECWIICGPIFKTDNKDSIKKIGSSQVWVPTYFYKIVAYKDKQKVEAVGFIMPHEDIKGDLTTYVVKIRDIESLTGLDFFNKLSKDEEENLEQSLPIKSKFFNN